MLKLKIALIYFVVSVTVYILIQYFAFGTTWKHAGITGLIMGALSTPLFVLFFNYYRKEKGIVN